MHPSARPQWLQQHRWTHSSPVLFCRLSALQISPTRPLVIFFFSRREGGVGVSPLLSLTPPIPPRFEFLPLAFHWLAEQETRPTQKGKQGCASPATASSELEPGGGEGRGNQAGGAWFPLASEDRPAPFKNPTVRRTASPQLAFGVPLARRQRMVVSRRAGCRAALSLWILSSFICRAWMAPSTFRK